MKRSLPPKAVADSPTAGPPIYMDYQATTPVDARVLEAMLPWFHERFGNPHSTYHRYGWRAEEAVEQAREQVASLLGASSKEIIFTSGATEANNLALKGLAEAHKGRKNHIITVSTEHKCVLETCRWLEGQGWRVTYLPVQKNGIIELKELEKAITPETLVVSVMAVNNEIGVIQPLEDIGRICRAHEVHFHCDAAQAFGKIPLDVNTHNIDLLSISGHKVYGPQGVGALYVRRRPKVTIAPQLHGGTQERGIRAGTVAAPLAVGLGMAAQVASQEMQEETTRLQGFYEHFLSLTVDKLEGVTLNGDRTQRFPGNLNLCFEGVEGDSMILALKELAVSSGSACASGSPEPSYVLRALEVPASLSHTAIRFGIGRFTTEEEIEAAIHVVTESFTRLRKRANA